MLRPKSHWCVLIAPVLLLAMLVISCSGSAEEPMVRRFFQASKMGDNTTLGNIAAVAFDPKTDGQVENFSVTGETPEQAQPLKFRELGQAVKDAIAADEEFSKRKKAYQDENVEAIDRILKAESKNATLRGKDAEIQAAWNKWREETKASAMKVSEARAKLSAERRVADLSIADRDVSGLEASQYTKEMTIDASVKSPDGQSAKKTLVLTLQRVIAQGEDGQPINGRWMITHIKTGG
jgi:hypothetical protein